MCNCLGGVYRATVIATADPEARGRVKLQVPLVLGTAPSAWAEPSVPHPVVPAAGDRVWVTFEGKNPSYPVYLAAR